MNFRKEKSELVALCACPKGIYGAIRADKLKTFLEKAEIGKGVYLSLDSRVYNLESINGWIQYIDGRLDFPTIYINQEPVTVITKDPPNPLCRKLTRIPLAAIKDYNLY